MHRKRSGLLNCNKPPRSHKARSPVNPIQALTRIINGLIALGFHQLQHLVLIYCNIPYPVACNSECFKSISLSPCGHSQQVTTKRCQQFTRRTVSRTQSLPVLCCVHVFFLFCFSCVVVIVFLSIALECNNCKQCNAKAYVRSSLTDTLAGWEGNKVCCSHPHVLLVLSNACSIYSPSFASSRCLWRDIWSICLSNSLLVYLLKELQ